MRTLGRLSGIAIIIVGATVSEAVVLAVRVFTLPGRILWGCNEYWRVTKETSE